jgi:hypothetical protein
LLDAREAGAQVLAFVRDSDGDEQRVEDITAAIRAHESEGSSPDVIGGAAVPLLEGWLLSMQGEAGAERLSKAAAQRRFLEKNGVLKDTLKAAQIVQEADLSRIPSNSSSLLAWLEMAKKVFAARIP